MFPTREQYQASFQPQKGRLLRLRCELPDWFMALIGYVIGATLLAGYGLILYVPYRRWRKKSAKTKKEKEAATTTPPATDKLYDEAVAIVLKENLGSVSLLQRELKIGYGRAARLIHSMANDGIVGDYNDSQTREVLMTAEEWAARKPS